MYRNTRNRSFSFETSIDYKDWDIYVTVEFDYYVGTTPAMGDDPTEIQLECVIDGTNSNILPKLDEYTIALLLEQSHEHAINSFNSFE